MERTRVTAGANIKAARQAAGMSLAVLSSASGVSKGYLSQIENGRVGSPTGDVLASIARALGTSVDALIRDRGSNIVDSSLAAAAMEHGWSYGTARMLAAVNVEGLRPETEEDYEAVYKAILATLQGRREKDRAVRGQGGSGEGE